MRLFDYIEAALQLFPPQENNAERVTARTWILPTPGGINVAEIDVFFTFKNGEVHIEDAFAA